MTNQATPRSAKAKVLVLPLLSVAFGVGYLVVGLLGDRPDLAIGGPVLMFALAAGMLLFRGRSETIKGLMDRRDERINTLDMRATAATGLVLVLAVLSGFLVEVARGHTGQPYLWLGAVAGLTYIVALVVLRLRR